MVVGIDDILTLLGFFGQLFAKTKKGKWLLGSLSTILTYHALIEETRAKFEMAAKAGGGLTLTTDEVATLRSMFTQIDDVLDKVKERL